MPEDTLSPDLEQEAERQLEIKESALVEASQRGGYNAAGDPDPNGIFDADKSVRIHILRPCVGKGKGTHLYEAKMLQENAPVFSGWKMNVDHLSPQARKAAGGLPRGVRDLGGRVLESEWDPSVPADPAKDFEQGAVVGRVRPVRWLREMIEDDPELIETSISAAATAVRPDVRNGKRVWVVEGIAPRGTVDWVSEAGAGGRVAAKLEESYSDEEQVEEALLESMLDDEVADYLQRERPHLLEAAVDTEEAKKGWIGSAIKRPGQLHRDLGVPENEDIPDAAIEAAAKRNDKVGARARLALKLKRMNQAGEPAPEGDDDMPLTPQALREAVEEDPTLAEAIVGTPAVQGYIDQMVESKLDTREEMVRAEARADANRVLQLGKLEREAHKLIDESKLPPKWRESAREMFRLSESGRPTPMLDVVDDVDEEGRITKSALAKVREAVQHELSKSRELLAEASPTRVRDQGLTELDEADSSARRVTLDPKRTEDGQYLTEVAGVKLEEAYALEGVLAQKED